MTQSDQSSNERAWIVWPDGQRRLGPFESFHLALKVREYVERADHRVDLAVMTESELA